VAVRVAIGRVGEAHGAATFRAAVGGCAAGAPPWPALIWPRGVALAGQDSVLRDLSIEPCAPASCLRRVLSGRAFVVDGRDGLGCTGVPLAVPAEVKINGTVRVERCRDQSDYTACRDFR
jgi:hypothetical protein